ncbi:hypothetical protein TNCV_3227401 [Trichonephila clavipes]|nr:hypothetical protein TNCV_3227401 [Trichonephila clavipes]
MNKSHNIAPIPVLNFHNNRTTIKTSAGSQCLLVLAAALRFAPTPSLRPMLATLYFEEVRPSALVSFLESILTSFMVTAGCLHSSNWAQIL